MESNLDKILVMRMLRFYPKRQISRVPGSLNLNIRKKDNHLELLPLRLMKMMG